MRFCCAHAVREYDYVLLLSSLHQSELAALYGGLCTGELKQPSKVLVLIDDRDIPEGANLWALDAHHALPTSRVVSSGGAFHYRQQFRRLRDGEPLDNLQALAEAVSSWTTSLSNDGESVSSTVGASRTYAMDASPEFIESFVCNVISAFSEVELTTCVLSDAQSIGIGIETSYSALLALTRAVVDGHREGAFEFAKGGALRLVFDGSPIHADAAVLDRGTVKGETVNYSSLRGDVSLSLNAETGRAEIAGLKAPVNLGVEFSGPLIMVWLASIGMPLDVPWYSAGVERCTVNNQLASRELVSPISVCDSRRADPNSGLRLDPTGYSYVECPVGSVLELVRTVLRDPELIAEDLMPWIEVLREYPHSPEKLLKSQSGLKELCQRREESAYQALRRGEVKTISLTDQRGARYRTGSELLCWAAWLRILRKQAFTGEECLSLQQQDYLESVGVHRAGTYSSAASAAAVRDCIVRSQAFRALFEVEHDHAPTSKLRMSDDLTWLARQARNEAHEYYSLAVTLAGSVLKFNAFTASCVVGRDGVEEWFKQILTMRGKTRTLILAAKPWRFVSGA